MINESFVAERIYSFVGWCRAKSCEVQCIKITTFTDVLRRGNLRKPHREECLRLLVWNTSTDMYVPYKSWRHKAFSKESREQLNLQFFGISMELLVSNLQGCIIVEVLSKVVSLEINGGVRICLESFTMLDVQVLASRIERLFHKTL